MVLVYYFNFLGNAPLSIEENLDGKETAAFSCYHVRTRVKDICDIRAV